MKNGVGNSVSMVDWLNENAYRSFPFAEGSDFVCSDGVSFPNWMILDAKAVVTPEGRSGDRFDCGVFVTGFTIRKIQDQAYVSVAVDVSVKISGPSGSRTLSGSLSSNLVPGKIYPCRFNFFSDDGFPFDYAVLSMFIGGPATVNDAEALVGSHQLKSPRKLIQSRVIVYPGGFGSDTIYGDDGFGASGDVHVRDGYNTSLKIAGDRIQLRISGESGLGYECSEDKGCDAIYYINGQRANSDGSFNFIAGEGVQIHTGTYNGIPAVYVTTTSLVDSYAKPR